LDNSGPRVARQKLDKLFDKEWFSPVTDGFPACGLYPWNAETTVFSECLGGGKKLPRNAPSTHSGQTVTYKIFHEAVRIQLITGIGSLSFIRCQNYILVDRSDLFKTGNLVGWNGEGTDCIAAYRERKFMAGIVS
jgi:hypothetical protein